MRDRRVFFVRHGLADRSAWDGPDHLRPLTPEGIERMERSAGRMADLGLGVDLVLTSPLTRARQTAEIVAAALDPSGGLVEDARLAGGFDDDALGDMLRENADVDRILLAGHEPSFGIVVGRITGGSHIICKKGSLLRVDLWGEDPPRGDLVWSIPPKVLAGD